MPRGNDRLVKYPTQTSVITVQSDITGLSTILIFVASWLVLKRVYSTSPGSTRNLYQSCTKRLEMYGMAQHIRLRPV